MKKKKVGIFGEKIPPIETVVPFRYQQYYYVFQVGHNQIIDAWNHSIVNETLLKFKEQVIPNIFL